MGKKNKTIMAIILVLMAFGAWLAFGLDEKIALPLSAENMTVEERAENDQAVLLNDLRTYDVERVEIDYSLDSIKLHLTRKSTEQYIDEKVNNALKALDNVLEKRKGELTLEKSSYHYYVYGKDGRFLDKELK